MPYWDQYDEKRQAKPEVVAAIDNLLSSGSVKTVRYAGYAHEPILETLFRHLGKTFTVMDMPDRYRMEAAFHWEEEDRPFPGPPLPKFLLGVHFHFDGWPRSQLDLVIYDAAPGFRLDRIFEHTRPILLLLADEGLAAASHPDYEWSRFPTYALGRRKGGQEIDAGADDLGRS
jgi:hypothetical protein